MRKLMTAFTVSMLMTTPLLAQEKGGEDARGYVTGLGGFARSVGNTTGDVSLEGGVRIAPHLMVIGNLGRYGNLQGALQPTLDTESAALAANQNLGVTTGGTVDAWYGLGGLRFEVPTRSRVMPYVLGEIGRAHLSPNPQFFFSTGTLPDGSSPVVGEDVTTALVNTGSITVPPSSTATMMTAGGGMQVLLARRWTADAGYRYSRIAADSALSTSALNTNGMTFGIGYRF